MLVEAEECYSAWKGKTKKWGSDASQIIPYIIQWMVLGAQNSFVATYNREEIICNI